MLPIKDYIAMYLLYRLIPRNFKMNMRHPSFSDFTYHFPERIPNTIAPI